MIGFHSSCHAVFLCPVIPTLFVWAELRVENKISRDPRGPNFMLFQAEVCRLSQRAAAFSPRGGESSSASDMRFQNAKRICYLKGKEV
jgi:hypothetical protein